MDPAFGGADVRCRGPNVGRSLVRVALAIAPLGAQRATLAIHAQALVHAHDRLRTVSRIVPVDATLDSIWQPSVRDVAHWGRFRAAGASCRLGRSRAWSAVV